MKPVPLASPAHHDEATLTRLQIDVIGCLPGWRPVAFVCRTLALSEHKGPTLTEHKNADERVIEPLHGTVTVQALKVQTISIQQRAHAVEHHAVLRLEMKSRLAHGRHGVSSSFPDYGGISVLQRNRYPWVCRYVGAFIALPVPRSDFSRLRLSGLDTSLPIRVLAKYVTFVLRSGP